MINGVQGHVLNDGLDPFFLGELHLFSTNSGVGEIFCEDGHGVGWDRAIFQKSLGQVALVQSHSLLHIRGKEEIIVSA